LASENDAVTFVLVDAENSPESKNVSNFQLLNFRGVVNKTQTNKQEVLIELVDEIV
jgi:ethanolamine ammonia-lyase large subunit